MPPTDPPDPLPGDLVQRLQRAIVAAFARSEVEQLVRFHLNAGLDVITGGGPFDQVVFDLLRWAERHGRVGELARAAKDARPGRPDLQAAADDVLARPGVLLTGQERLADARRVAAGLLDPPAGAATPAGVEHGLGVLAEVARNFPYRTPEVIEDVCRFVRARWDKRRPADGAWGGVLALALRVLSALPKRDPNGHPYYVELTQVRVAGVDLKGANLAGFVLWGSEFRGVNLSRGSFRDADLGGCVFADGTSVEWCDFAGAQMNFSFMDQVATTFDRVRLWGAKLDEARIDCCRMLVCDGFDSSGLKAKFGDRLDVRVVPPPPP
jgi:hypothetical protein